MAASKAGFRDFVLARRHRLLRTAYLLTRDHARAVRLLERALVRTRRHWRQLVWGDDPEGFALRCLAALHGTRRREWGARAGEIAGRVAARLARCRLGSGSGGGSGSAATGSQGRNAAAERPREEAGAEDLDAGDAGNAGDGGHAASSAASPDAADAPGDRPVHDAFWAELGRLRPRARAALVLRYYEELAEDEAAEALGCSLAALRREETRGLARLGAALTSHPSGDSSTAGSPGRRGVENELREVLAAQAAALPPENDPYDRTVRGIRHARWRRAAVSAVCLCVLAAVAVPVAVFRPFRDVPLEGWYVRGSLADDSAFLEAARAKAVDKAELKSSQEVEYSREIGRAHV